MLCRRWWDISKAKVRLRLHRKYMGKRRNYTRESFWARGYYLRSLPAILKGGFYRQLAAYGHMGRLDLGIVPWEEIDKAPLLQSAAGH